jgi:hypothetical protein
MKLSLKKIILFGLFVSTIDAKAQSPDESQVLHLSKQIFNWEVENKIDSLAGSFDTKFFVVSSAGETQTKDQYLTRLRSGSFIHNSIEVEESVATVIDNTATLSGKGKFTVTVSGKRITIHLSYLEVFTRSNKNTPWKIMAMHASNLQN